MATGQKHPRFLGVQPQGESFDELLNNIYEAVEGCLAVDVQEITISEKDKVMEIAVCKLSVGKGSVGFLKARAGT